MNGFKYPEIPEYLDFLNEDKLSSFHNLKLKINAQKKDLIDLTMINPDMEPEKVILDKLQEVINQKNSNRYAVAKGIRRLRNSFAKLYHDLFDIHLNPDSEICISMGSKDAILHSLMLLTNQNDEILLPSPYYPAHLSALKMLKLNYSFFKLESDEDLMLENIKRKINDNLKVILLNFPNNPTGISVSSEFYNKLEALIRGKNITIINDFVYAELYFDKKVPSLLENQELRKKSIEVYSISKGYSLPGWRVGAVLGNSRVIDYFSKLKSNLDYGIYLPIQMASSYVVANQLDFPSRFRTEYARRYQLFFNKLKEMSWQPQKADAGCAIWAKLPPKFKDMNSLTFANNLLEKYSVAALPGECFGSMYSNYLRFALVADTKQLEQALEKISKFQNEN